MNIRDLVPWGKKNESCIPIRREGANPTLTANAEWNHLFDELWKGFPFSPQSIKHSLFDAQFPKLNISETEKEVLVEAELPGLSEKDIDVSLHENVLSLKGEIKEEKEESKKGFYIRERAYGTFHREIPLPTEVSIEDAAAVFKNGLLRVTFPKTGSSEVKKIQIKSE